MEMFHLKADTLPTMQNFALKILVVEDNDELREVTLELLQSRGHYVRGVPMAEDINDITGGFVPDIYVIDLNLPDEDGLSLTKRLRQMQPSAGIVIATARAQIGDRVLGYESGADLYFTKPVHPRELTAGIAALGKRLQSKTSTSQGHLQVHMAKLELSGPEGCTDLTAGEMAILSALVLAPGRTLERWQLMSILSKREESISPSALEMRVARLRKKLASVGTAAPSVKSLHKVGYTLCCEVVLV